MERHHLVAAGYWCKEIAARCCFELTDEPGRWLVDTTVRPIAPRQDDGGGAAPDVEIRLSSAALHWWVRRGYPGKLLDNGRLEISGRAESVRRFWASRHRLNKNALYSALADLVPDPRFVFMNNGYAEDAAPRAADDRTWPHASALVRHVVAGVTLRGRKVLDVGCGRGGACAYMLQHGRPSQIVGLDVSPENVAFCRRAHAPLAIAFLVGDAVHLPFAPATFDVVTNVESSHCYSDLPAFFANVRRALAPGGLLCWADAFAPDRVGDVASAVAAAGTVVQWNDITQEVRRAMDVNRAAYEDLIRSMRDVHLDNTWVLDALISRNDIIREEYANGQLAYVSAQVKFP